jgi:hypothetical protein
MCPTPDSHAAMRDAPCVSGWEEWDLDSEPKVIASRDWYDAADHKRQTKGQ